MKCDSRCWLDGDNTTWEVSCDLEQGHESLHEGEVDNDTVRFVLRWPDPECG